MISAIGSATSAITALDKKMDVTSNNIANVNTDEFKKSRVTFQEGANGGVEANVQQIDTPGYTKETVSEGDLVEVESSNVDLAEELTEMIPTQAAYSANIKTIQTQNQMMGSLLDLFG